MRNTQYRSTIPVLVCLVLAAVAMCFCAVETASAQRRSTIQSTPVRATPQPLRATAAPSVPVIKISPAESPAEKASGALTGRRQHKPLTITKKVELLAGGSGGVGGADLDSQDSVPLTTEKLSVRDPYAPNRASLGFTYPRYVSPMGDTAVFQKSGQLPLGHLTLHLNLEQGERYLVDFSVFAGGTRTYTVNFPAGSQQFKGSGEMHVLFVLEAQESGWSYTELHASDDFYFYGAEVSKMD